MLAGVVVAAIVATACSTALPSVEPGHSPADVIVVPLDVAPGAGLGSGPQGGCGSVAFSDMRLQGDATASPAVWVVDVDGGDSHPIRWPPGFSARFEPALVIYDARGRAVGREGDVLKNTSGYPQSDQHPMTLFSFNGVDYPCK
jgi:hypothetical protein